MLAFTLAVALVVLAGCDRWEVLEEAYASRDEVVRRGAIERGWIPVWIPESAREIHEVHDLDTNVSQLAFGYAEFDIAKVSANCRPATADSIVLPRRPMAEWWPKEMRRGSSNLKPFLFFECPKDREPHAYVAVDSAGSRAFFWREWAS